jgi:hypothetical protein
MNWIFQNFSNRIRFALKNPLYALGSLYRALTLMDEKFLSSITTVSASRIRGFIEEPTQNGFFSQRLQSVRAESRNWRYTVLISTQRRSSTSIQ